MPAVLIECIPNLSGARRPEVAYQIAAAIFSVEGACRFQPLLCRQEYSKV